MNAVAYGVSHIRPLLVVLTGATGVGKTSVAVELAKNFCCPILSADSRQIYAEMPIGTAAPSVEQLAEVKHYFIASRSIHDQPYNASAYESEALQLLQILFPSHPVLIVCGGSMMYVDALCRGLDELPQIPNDLRLSLRHEYQTYGLSPLRLELQRSDPDYLQRIDDNNYKRILRALEVIRHTGKPFSSFHKQAPHKRPFCILHIDLFRHRPELFARIDERVEMMFRDGLEEEARALYPYRHLNALDTVGYKELFAYFDGEIDLSDAISLIKRNTRIYARKQETYWRRRPEITRPNLSTTPGIIDRLVELIDYHRSV